MSLENRESAILKIIETLTTTGQRTLDEDAMKKLKKICKLSNDYVSYAYYALMTQLRKKHSEIRYSALLIMNELFCRSFAFRKLLEVDLEEFLQLVAETDPENPLPLPQSAAKALKLKGLEFMQDWCSKFGVKYTRLQLALTYLKKCKKVDFNDMEVRNAAQREHQRQEQERLDRLQNAKINVVKAEMKDLAEEISNLVIQMENCFRLLIPHPVEFFSHLDFENNNLGGQTINSTNSDNVDNIEPKTDAPNSQIDTANFSENSLRQHGIYDMKQTIVVEVENESKVAVNVTEDNLPIIENLKDLQKQITARYLPVVTKWLKVLTKGSNCSDTLKQAIDLKRLLESALEKYRELQIKPGSSNLDDDDDDDDFEEVEEKDGYEAVVHEEFKASESLQPQPGCSKSFSTVEKAYMWKLKHSEEDDKDPTSATSTLNRLKEKYKFDLKDIDSSVKGTAQTKAHKGELLEKAPVLPYDIDLYHWEDEKPLVPEVVKFDSLHKFWDTKDDDDNDEKEALKEVQIASLRTRKIDFSGKFEPVKWSCRAPLPSGKLCPRKDRYKCPFHGKIIKRDSLGNPVDNMESTPGPSSQNSVTAVPDWQDPELLQDIESATGINLKIPIKKSKSQKQVKGIKKKCGLTNINFPQTNAKERLAKKIMKRYKHYAPKLDEIERKKFNDKFGDQWNYY